MPGREHHDPHGETVEHPSGTTERSEAVQPAPFIEHSDVVTSKKQPHLRGLVQVVGPGEYELEPTEDSEIEAVEAGFARVWWGQDGIAQGTSGLWDLDDLVKVCAAVLPGDVIRTQGPNARVGAVDAADMILRVTPVSPFGQPTGENVEVSPRQLLPLQKFYQNDACVWASTKRFAGIARMVAVDLVVAFPNPQTNKFSMCIVPDADPNDWQYDIELPLHDEHPFFPGQKIRVHPEAGRDVFAEDAVFIQGEYKKKVCRDGGVVCGVLPHAVELMYPESEEVGWAHAGDLLCLREAWHMDFSIGDVCLLLDAPLPPGTDVNKFYEHLCGVRPEGPDFAMSLWDSPPDGARSADAHYESGTGLLANFNMKLACITSMQKMLTVRWDDGTVETDVDSALVAPETATVEESRLYPTNVVWPEERLVAHIEEESQRNGGGSVAMTVPLFDVAIRDMSSNDFFSRDIVRFQSQLLRMRAEQLVGPTTTEMWVGYVKSFDAEKRLCDVKWTKQRLSEVDYFPTTIWENSPDPEDVQAEHPDKSTWVGEVVCVTDDTMVHVKWGHDGSVTQEFRGNLCVLRLDEEEEDYTETASSWSVRAASEASEGPPPLEPRTDWESEAAPETGGTGVFGKVTGALRNAWRSVVRRAAPPTVDADQDLGPTADGHGEEGEESHGPLEGPTDDVTAEESATPPESDPAGGDALHVPFSHSSSFSLCSTFSGHILRDDFAPVNLALFQKRVNREWMLLQKPGSLPPGSFVKCSEAEMHLLKFAVVGPTHTPYNNGLFFFEVLLPSTYPHDPPVVKFLSNNRRLNPNLYADGTVCLSLLGTWEGHEECERWHPVHSNVLQVIISTQGIILCKEPYYNEAGFDVYRGTESGTINSKTYNENAFIQHVTHMFTTAENPPKDWGYEVRTHFRETTPPLLQRLKDYVSLPSSALGPDGTMTKDGLVIPLSEGFKLSVSRMLADLEARQQRTIAVWDDEEEKLRKLMER